VAVELRAGVRARRVDLMHDLDGAPLARPTR
jgi:hypothetical protein